MKKWAAADLATAVEGSAAGDTIKTASANKAAGTGATATCTNSITYTIPKAAKNVVVTASKTAGIIIGDKGAYGTVKFAQAAKLGCPNGLNTGCSTSAPTTADSAVASANTAAGGLGVYQAVKSPGEIFVWGVTVKAGTAAAAATAKNDTKKSATTLAVGTAAVLVAAAIA